VEVLALVVVHGAILGTAHLSPEEIFVLVKRAREAGVEKVVLTHPFFKVPGLDVDSVAELARMGAMPEFAYCTISPAWHHATPERICEAIARVGASRCLLVSDSGQRHNPPAPEALRVFAQTLFEKGVDADDISLMVRENPAQLLELDGERASPTAEELAWAAAKRTGGDDSGPAAGDGNRAEEVSVRIES
jgi:hypothetical protein